MDDPDDNIVDEDGFIDLEKYIQSTYTISDAIEALENSISDLDEYMEFADDSDWITNIRSGFVVALDILRVIQNRKSGE
jgi:hypothetical protein